MIRRCTFTLLLALVFCSAVQAQTGGTGSTPAKNKAKSAKDLEAERILKERRANAQSLLINLAADARNFKDQTLRARTQARIADALWEVDRERARAMFRAAWDAAEIAIKAANSAENFTGEDGALIFRMISKGINAVHQSSVADFDVAPLFEQLAGEDYERSVELAGGFTRESPRAIAVMAIAHAILSEKRKPSVRAQ